MGGTGYLFGPAAARLMSPPQGFAPPPGDPELLGSVEALTGGLHSHAPHLASLLGDYLGWSRGLPLPTTDAVLGFLDMEIARRKGHNREHFVQARRETWLASVRVLAPYMDRPPCTTHLRLFEALTPRDFIISLSRTSMVDRAFEVAGQLVEGDQSMEWTYGREFRKLAGAGVAGGSKSLFRLLKLRGSFSWLRCRGCRLEYAAPAEHPVPDSPDFRFPCVHPASMFEPVWLLAGRGQSGIPAALRGIWTGAARAIKSAARLVVIDDPFVEPDLALEWLLRRTLAGRGRRLEVDLVLREGEAAPERLLSVLEGASVEPVGVSLPDLVARAVLPGRLF